MNCHDHYKQIPRLRRGRTFTIEWEILTNGEPVPLRREDFTLFLHDRIGLKMELKDFRMAGENQNVVTVDFEGTQTARFKEGRYSMTLWMNYQTHNQIPVDKSDVFEIVGSTEAENFTIDNSDNGTDTDA